MKRIKSEEEDLLSKNKILDILHVIILTSNNELSENQLEHLLKLVIADASPNRHDRWIPLVEFLKDESLKPCTVKIVSKIDCDFDLKETISILDRILLGKREAILVNRAFNIFQTFTKDQKINLERTLKDIQTLDELEKTHASITKLKAKFPNGLPSLLQQESLKSQLATLSAYIENHWENIEALKFIHHAPEKERNEVSAVAKCLHTTRYCSIPMLFDLVKSYPPRERLSIAKNAKSQMEEWDALYTLN